MRQDELRTSEQIQAVLKEIEAQTDRGAAIIASQTVEVYLKSLILARFKEISHKQEERLFDGPNAPLSSFFAKIEIAYALAVIADEDRSALHLVRDVRNAFAHRIEALTFDHQEIAVMIRSRMDEKIKTSFPKFSPRGLFLYRCNILMIRLGLAAQHGDMRLRQFEVTEQKYFKDVVALMEAAITNGVPLTDADLLKAQGMRPAPDGNPW